MSHPPNPIPIPVPSFYEFNSYNRSGRRWWVVPEYESNSTTNDGKIVPPVTSEMMTYLTTYVSSGRGSPGSPSAKQIETLTRELVAVLSITPHDDLLADYRAMRIRAFFERFLRAAIDALVSPDGASNAARVLTSDGGFRKDSFSELSRALIASLLSGKDSSIASAVRVYLLATG